MANIHHITIFPKTSIINAGQSQSYSVTAYKTATQPIGDGTAHTRFSISRSAGGYWRNNVYTSQKAGKWTVTASYSMRTATAVLEVVKPIPVFQLSNMIINPTEVVIENPVTISVTVANTGTAQGTKIVTLEVTSMTSLNESITLNPGQSGQVDFAVTPSQPGIYNVRVDGLAGTFTAVPLPTPIPAAFKGILYPNRGVAAEYDDVLAFPYMSSTRPWTAYIHIESNEGARDLAIPNNPSSYLMSGGAVILTDRNTLYLAYITVKSSGLVVNKYSIGDGLTLLSSVSFGNADSRLGDFIRLSSGKLVLGWYQQTSAGGQKNIGFAYTDSYGNWHNLNYVPLAANLNSAHATMCQHPDGSIWWFSSHDSERAIRAIHLSESGETIAIDWKDDNFIRKSTVIAEMVPDGECPWLSAITSLSRNGIVLAYQCDKYHVSGNATFILSKITCIKVNSDGSKEYLFYLDQYVEDKTPFVIGIDKSDNIYTAYGRADLVELSWHDLYFNDVFLGQMYGCTQTDQTPQAIYRSSKYIIAGMSDLQVRLWRVE
jgi:hypothetical protein